VLIRCQLKVAFVNLGDLPQTGLEVLLRLVLHAAILDEGSVVVSTIIASDPAKFVDVTREVERASRLKPVPKSLLNFRQEVLEPHPVNGILQPSVFTTLGASENTTQQDVAIENVLHTVTVVSLDQHNLLCHILTLLHCAKTEDIGSSGVRLLVSMRNTHSTSSSDIESGEFTVLVHDCDEADIIGEEVDVIRRGDGNGNFELKVYISIGERRG
jgi:hypothetical protein